MTLSTLSIHILLHYYLSKEKFTEFGYPSVPDKIKYLLNEGLLETTGTGNNYEVTEKGEAHITGLCALPLPTAKWISPAIEVS